MSRWRVVAMVSAVILLGGCNRGPLPESVTGGDWLHHRAHDVLARYDQAAQAAGGLPTFIPVGDLTGQVGDWEPAAGERDKLALMAGRLIAVVPLPPLPSPTG